MSLKKLPNKKALPKSDDQQSVSKLVIGGEKEQKISLYIRAANWLKNRDTVLGRFQEIHPKIQAVRHPRQKSADFCFIDFASIADRDQAFKELKGHADLTVKAATVDVPKLLDRRVQKVNEYREKKKEARKLKRELGRKNKSADKKPKATSTEIIITNVPVGVTVAELKTHFPECINARIHKKKNREKDQPKPKSHSAVVTFATPKDAKNASRQQIELQERKLFIRLNMDRKQKSKKEKEEKATDKDNQSEEDQAMDNDENGVDHEQEVNPEEADEEVATDENEDEDEDEDADEGDESMSE